MNLSWRRLLHVAPRETLIYLLLHVIFASMFTLIIKWIQLRDKEDVITVGSINYIVAALFAFPYFWSVPTNASTSNAIWTGGSMGQVYFIAFFFVIYCIKHVGASVTTVVSVLSLLFPITLAAFIWQEFPSYIQSVGIIIAIFSLLLISVRRSPTSLTPNSASYWSATLMLLIFFGLCGCSRLAQETFKHISQPDQRPVFLFAAFGVAGAYSLGALLYRRRRISLSEWLLGLLMGLANLLQTQLVLKCLEVFPGFIVFTVTSAGAIVLTTLVATLLFKERIEKSVIVGIGLAVIALAILNFGRSG